MAQAFSGEQLAAILAALPDPAFILTRSGRYAAVFGGSDLRYYHDGTPLVGRSLGDVLNKEKAAWFVGEIEKALAAGNLHIVEYGLAGSDVKGLAEEGPEHVLWFEGRIQALDFPVDGEDAVMWIATNITSRHDLEERLRGLSETDALTGLANRRSLMGALKLHHDLFARYGTPTAVMAFDVDHLKGVNDGHGHLVGDRIIIAVGEVCRTELRTTDFPARFGGDEFVVLMPQTGLPLAEAFAERLRQRASRMFRDLNIPGVRSSISVGLTEFRPEDRSFEDALSRADDALYEAKAKGRNQVVRR